MVDALLDENIVSRFSQPQAVTYFNLYLKNANILIESLTLDFQKNDIESVRGRAHKLKGSSTVIGATRIKELSMQIEEDAREEKKTDETILLQLKEEFEQLSKLLKVRYNIV